MQLCIIYVCVCVCVCEKRKEVGANYIYLFFSVNLINPLKWQTPFASNQDWVGIAPNAITPIPVKKKKNYSYFLTFLPFFNSTVEIKVVFFNIKSQLFRTIVLCAVPQSASLTTSMLFNPIKSGNLPSLSFAKSNCCHGSFIKIINLTLKTKVSNALQ